MARPRRDCTCLVESEHFRFISSTKRTYSRHVRTPLGHGVRLGDVRRGGTTHLADRGRRGSGHGWSPRALGEAWRPGWLGLSVSTSNGGASQAISAITYPVSHAQTGSLGPVLLRGVRIWQAARLIQGLILPTLPVGISYNSFDQKLSNKLMNDWLSFFIFQF